MRFRSGSDCELASMTVRPLAGRGFARHGSANDALFPDHERYKSGDAAKWMPDPGTSLGSNLFRSPDNKPIATGTAAPQDAGQEQEPGLCRNLGRESLPEIANRNLRLGFGTN
jgi:hypothetical protein